MNVTRTITDAVKKITAKSPELGDHLAKTIKTGASCVYDPDAGMPVFLAILSLKTFRALPCVEEVSL